MIIKVVEVMDEEAFYPVEINFGGLTVMRLTKKDAVQMIEDLQKAVDNLE